MPAQSKLNGQTFPKDPISTRWERILVSTRGNGRKQYARRQNIVIDLPLLTQVEYDFFYAQWISGSFHNLYITAPGNQGYLDISGVVIDNVDAEEPDIDGYRFGVNVKFSRVTT